VKPTDLRGILQYIPLFRNRPFVISLDGSVLDHKNIGNVLLDIAVLRSLNIKVILVHGAAAQISQLSKKSGVSATDLWGSGKTDEATLEMAIQAANLNTHRILAGLTACGVHAAQSNAIRANPAGLIKGLDLLNTGKIHRIESVCLNSMLDQGITPVVPPLGFNAEGNTLRVNSDNVAIRVAEKLNAEKIVFMTASNGLYRRQEFIRELSVEELNELLDSEVELEPKGILSKARCAAEACRSGIPRVHIINGCIDEALLTEIYSNEGIGTLIYSDEYQQIRKAELKDTNSILRLIRNSVENEELISRERLDIEKQIDCFHLIEIDGNPVGCVALIINEEEQIGEVACLYVDAPHANQGIGQKLLGFINRTSKERGLKRLMALSTQAFSYFENKGGFRQGEQEELPKDKREQYVRSGRNSRIMIKDL
jgi:amino-acid N-acetyltransferase